MTLETIYFIGQTIAAFAIVGSLIFVGLQSRQASRASELMAFQITQDRFDGIRKLLVADTELTELFDRGLRDPGQLDETELVRFRLMMFVVAESAQSAYLLHEGSQSKIATWESFESAAARTLITPGGRAWWAMFRSELNEKFVKRMDPLLVEHPIGRVVTRDDWINALNALANEKTGANEQ
ncbi:hypothetical protein [Altererythrobacter sp. MF3-039]|uniref:hypothetical protein n=1 Tax=Altererythrobacter sp. MF3-039 TaxID=3252901 RepID=UPI00390C6EE9